MGSQKVQFWQFRAEQHAKTIECCFNSSNQHTSHIRIIKRQNQSVDSAFFLFPPHTVNSQWKFLQLRQILKHYLPTMHLRFQFYIS